MNRNPIPSATNLKASYPSPPRLHWAILFVAIAGSEGLVLWLVPQPYRDFLVNLVIAAWPIYLCLWIRKIDIHSLSLYWALASFATGFLFSWLLPTPAPHKAHKSAFHQAFAARSPLHGQNKRRPRDGRAGRG